MFIDKAYGSLSVGAGRDSCTKWENWFYIHHKWFNTTLQDLHSASLSWSYALLSAADAGSFRVLYWETLLPRALRVE